MTRLLALLALLAGACAKKPTAQETLPQLRAALGAPVSSEVQNKQHSALAELVSEEKHLQGLSRLEVEQQLGQGEDCGRHPICGERGFDDSDWYYEVGTQGESYVRYRPALIVGFNRFGKVERTFVLRVE